MEFIMEFIMNVYYEYADLLSKILLCAILTGLIGYNREINGMTVGIRTHILVGLSAVLLQVMSLEFSAKSGYSGDALRVAGQLVSGVGFLGAGAIIKDSKNIRGLTTAASIFFAACIGLAVGIGIYVPSILITLCAYLFLIDAFKLKKLVSYRKSNLITLGVEISGLYQDHSKEIKKSLRDIGAEIDYIDANTISMEKSKIDIRINITDEISVNDILSALIDVDAVVKTEIKSRK